MAAPWTLVPFHDNMARDVTPVTEVPEKFETCRITTSQYDNQSRPTQLAPSNAFNYLDNLVRDIVPIYLFQPKPSKHCFMSLTVPSAWFEKVDSIFDGIFDSVDGSKFNSGSASATIRVKQERRLNSPEGISVTDNFQDSSAFSRVVSLGPHTTGRVVGGPIGGTGLRFKARCPTILPNLDLCGGSGGPGVYGITSPEPPHTLASSTTALSEPISDGDLTSCVSTATTMGEHSTSTQGECSFMKFAAAYFQTGSTPSYTSSRLLRPLFKHRSQHDLLVTPFFHS